MTLATWQSRFAAVLDGTQDRAALLPLLVNHGAISAMQGLDVYRSNTRGARVRALEAVLPVCRKVLGSDCFAGVAAHWASVRPSGHWDLNRAGNDFPDYLGTLVCEREEYAVLPWLPDLARLEWLLHRAYYQANAPAPDFRLLSEIDDPGCLLPKLAPCVAVLESVWPVLQIWEDHQHGGEPGPLAESVETTYLVIDRPEFRPRAVPVSREIYRLLAACLDAWDLNRISQADSGYSDLLPELIHRGWLVGFDEPGRRD